jgi:hypothetical protein
VIATVALFAALAGSAFALGRHSVGTPQLKRGAVTSSKIHQHAVTRRKIARHAVGPAQIEENSITGQQVNEATLSQVPSAAASTNAENVDKLVPFGLVTAGAGEARTLVSYGPFSLIGRCEPEGEDQLAAVVVLATTEEHTSFGGEDNESAESGGDVGPQTPEKDRRISAVSSSVTGPMNSSGADGQFYAQAPSGRSWAGTVDSWASFSAGRCRWSGYIVKTS